MVVENGRCPHFSNHVAAKSPKRMAHTDTRRP